ncbi:MAG: hypothetical protein WDO24_19485 [Pseudomonadota bacterium]
MSAALAPLGDEHDVAVAEQEDLAVILLDQVLEGADRDPDMLVAAVMGQQPRQVDMDRAPPGAVAVDPVEIIEQLGILCRQGFVRPLAGPGVGARANRSRRALALLQSHRKSLRVQALAGRFRPGQ